MQKISLGIALSLTLLFLGVSAASFSKVAYGQCYSDPVVTCTNGPGETNGQGDVSVGTNGCASGYGFVEQSQVSCGGGDPGGGGDVGGGGVDPTPSPTTSVSLTVSPETVAAGAASTLSWNSNGVNACSINQGIGSVTANTSGSRSITPPQSATYVITCTTGQPSPGPTWQYSYSDISDLSCPVSQNTNVYSNVPNCPASPQGKSCTSGSCKINRANQSTCSIETDIYECVSSGSSTESSISAGATVTVTQMPDLVGQVGGAATATANQAVTLYGGVANQGMGDAGYFPNIVQVCDANCATVNQVLAATAIDPLNAGGWKQVSAAYTPTTASAQFYRVCANNNTSWVNVHAESNYSNNCSGWQNLTVGNQPTADLIASSITPTTATAGVAISLSATASNIGSATSGSFPLLFQVSETGALTNSSYIAALTSGASNSASANHTFSSAGTYQVRACANYNTSWTAIVPESNYANNCGPWTTVTVAAAGTPAVACTVSPTTIQPGQSVTYRANPSGGAGAPYTWTSSDGGSFGSGTTVNRTLTTAGVYAMNVDTPTTAVAYCPDVTVAATWCTNASTVLTITAAPNRVRAGQSVALTWSADGVNGEGATCSVSGPGVSWSSAVAAAPVCTASGSANPTITTQSTYTLTCGGTSKSVTVNVIPSFQEF